MRALGWNLRGFGWLGRRTQLRNYMKKEKIDIICLQGTLKQVFSDQELQSLEVGDKFY
jgi:hypothetical protein